MSEPSRPAGPLTNVMGTYHNVLFLIGAEELSSLLALAPFRIGGNSWIPAAEWPDGCVDYLVRYARYAEEMSRASPLLDPMHWATSLHLRLALTRDIYRPTPKPGEMIFLDQYEPDLLLEAAGAIIDPKGKLRVNVVSNVGGAVGLRLSYRKRVVYESEGFAIDHATESFPNFGLYRQIEGWIKSHTKPCRFTQANGTTVSTQLRASAEGRALLAQHAWLAAHAIKLV